MDHHFTSISAKKADVPSPTHAGRTIMRRLAKEGATGWLNCMARYSLNGLVKKAVRRSSANMVLSIIAGLVKKEAVRHDGAPNNANKRMLLQFILCCGWRKPRAWVRLQDRAVVALHLRLS